MQKRIKFQLFLESDYHSSSSEIIGAHMNSTIMCNAKGKPMIKGSTLAGLIRHQANVLKIHNPKLTPLFEEIFGSEKQQGICYFENAQIDTDLRKAIKKGNKIDFENRCAQDKMLYGIEIGGGGTFEFEICFNSEQQSKLNEALAYILVATKMVRHLGSKVHRGLGECRIQLSPKSGIDEMEEKQLIQWFEQAIYKKEATEFPLAKKIFSVEKSSQIELSKGKWQIVVKVVSPLVLGNKMDRGNTYETMQYISGTTALGAFTKIVGDTTKFYKMINQQQLLMSNLYPAHQINSKQCIIPTIPVPLTYKRCKSDPYHIKTDIVRHGIENGKCECGSTLQSVEGFMDLKTFKVITPLKHKLHMHVKMKQGERRASNGDLYSYEAIEQGYFVGDMILHNALELKGITYNTDLQQYEGYIYIGKGIKRGYGRCQIALREIESKVSVVESEQKKRVINDSEENTILFLSDTILKDTWGRCCTDSQQIIEQVMGKDALSCCLDKHKTFIKLKRIIRFSTYSGLPKTQEIAIKAGSVLCFKAPKQRTQERCIGELQQEGFGRVSINHPYYNRKGSEEKENPDYEIKIDREQVSQEDNLSYTTLTYKVRKAIQKNNKELLTEVQLREMTRALYEAYELNQFPAMQVLFKTKPVLSKKECVNIEKIMEEIRGLIDEQIQYVDRIDKKIKQEIVEVVVNTILTQVRGRR